MSVATFQAINIANDDAKVLDFLTKFIAALDSLPNLTRVTDQANRAGTTSSPNALFPYYNKWGGMAEIDLNQTNVTLTAGTSSGAVTNQMTISGTWSRPLTDDDLGRPIKVVNGATTYWGSVFSVNVGAQTCVMTLNGTTGAVNIAGTLTGTIGIYHQAIPTAGVGLLGSAYGWVIYRFNDPLQSSLPIFIKFRIYQEGQTGSASVGWHVGVFVGTALDGTGGVISNGNSGAQNSQIDFGTSSALASNGEPTTNRTWRFSSEAGRFSYMHWLDSAWTPTTGAVTLARSEDADGVQTDEFVHFIHCQGSNPRSYVIHRASNFTYPNDVAGFLPPPVAYMGNNITTLNYGGNVGVMPIPPVAGRVRPSLKDMFAVKQADFTRGQIVAVEGVNYCVCNGFSISSVTHWLLVRYN